MANSISPLRKRFVEDMTIHGLAAGTQKTYLREIERFSQHIGKSPHILDHEDVRSYRLHFIRTQRQPSTINRIMSALRFFYKNTLQDAETAAKIPMMRDIDRAPHVLSPPEVRRLLRAVEHIKYRTALSLVYASGLRVSEVVQLRLRDIESQRMVIHVRNGKGGKPRYTMLSKHLLDQLRDYWRHQRPTSWLFPDRSGDRPISVRSIQRACRQAALDASLDKPVTVHTLRHCFATHLLEQGNDIRIIQKLLGHKHITATTRYTQVAIDTVQATLSPLDFDDSRRQPTGSP